MVCAQSKIAHPEPRKPAVKIALILGQFHTQIPPPKYGTLSSAFNGLVRGTVPKGTCTVPYPAQNALHPPVPAPI